MQQPDFEHPRVVAVRERVVVLSISGGQQRLVFVGPGQFQPSGVLGHGSPSAQFDLGAVMPKATSNSFIPYGLAAVPTGSRAEAW